MDRAIAIVGTIAGAGAFVVAILQHFNVSRVMSILVLGVFLGIASLAVESVGVRSDNATIVVGGLLACFTGIELSIWALLHLVD
ncbi:hypothetical protein NLM24_31450 [Nocardia zapadnayensis]|uniref:hypothetical protein n=1 Tax=Nocardia rhamnosiphila TaxID=426716 RepID=UPI0022475978|nr:hypothetical protein [Nocardia zapadnayensis]MCX0275126.1 hypothetical protein [Nocardia zapadnayensis]